MKFFRIFVKLISFIYYFIKFRDIKFAYLLSHYNTSFWTAATIKRKGKYVEFTESGNKIPLKTTYLFKNELRYLIKVLNGKNTTVVSDDSGDGILLKVDGILLKVLSVSNIATVFEIFFQQLYNISTPENEIIIIDIGMNVGYATLFFAATRNAAHVYSYEPFPETFKEAVTNIELNEHLKGKITPCNYGISNKTKVLTVPHLTSGCASASTNPDFIKLNQETSDNSIQVEVKDIAEVMREIISKHPQKKIFLKIDCEGEEYDIMDRLNNHEFMKTISGFLIEWHIKGPDAIIKTLNENNFTSLHLPNYGIESGMIYSFHSNGLS